VLVAAGLRPRSSKQRHVPDNLSAVDQLWPQLVQLVEPYGLKRRDELTEEDVGEVRKEADDLRDPGEVAVEGKKTKVQ
jgi:adenylate kinase